MHSNMCLLLLNVWLLVKEIVYSYLSMNLLPLGDFKRQRPVMEELVHFLTESGYFHLQATKPDTIGTWCNFFSWFGRVFMLIILCCKQVINMINKRPWECKMFKRNDVCFRSRSKWFASWFGVVYHREIFDRHELQLQVPRGRRISGEIHVRRADR